MITFSQIAKKLSELKIPFETIEFSDSAISARSTDTSLRHNYDPDTAIKTIIISTKSGLIGVILNGKNKINTPALTNIVGRWSIVASESLPSKAGFSPGAVCPLVLDFPIIIDVQSTKLSKWSMGAGDKMKGISVSVHDCLATLAQARIVDIAMPDEDQHKSWYSKEEYMDAIEHLLTRGVDTIYPTREALEKVLRSGKKLTLYQGFDPTGTQLHIGHMVGFRKLRQWQDLGHHVIFLIGDGTGLAGDPSGKMKARGRFMSRQELRDNAVSYLKQASKIVRFEGDNPIEICYNGDWLTKLTLEDILNIAQQFTLQQMIERDMYQTRMKNGDAISLREFMYPLLQGYDSVAMNVDLEQGGTDQTFNMLAGRTLVKGMLGKEKFVMTVPLLADAKGVKIGKSEGNVIGLTDEPHDFFGKIMSLGDDTIIPCFTLLTDTPTAEIEFMQDEMRAGKNPMDLKKKLAFELTKQLNTEEDAISAQHDFETRFQKGAVSEAELPVVSLSTLPLTGTALDYAVALQLADSNSVARRFIDQKALKYNSVVVANPKEQVHIKPGDIFQAGRKAVKIGQ